MVMPPLPTLLADAARQAHGHLGPTLGTMSQHNAPEQIILFLGPGGSHHVAPIAQLEVSLVTLDLRFAENFADAIPRVLPVLLH